MSVILFGVLLFIFIVVKIYRYDNKILTISRKIEDNNREMYIFINRVYKSIEDNTFHVLHNIEYNKLGAYKSFLCWLDNIIYSNSHEVNGKDISNLDYNYEILQELYSISSQCKEKIKQIEKEDKIQQKKIGYKK